MKHTWKRLISVALSVCMLLALAVPALGAESGRSKGVSWEKVSNDSVAAGKPLRQYEEFKTEPLYKDNEIVRVSIVLSEMPTLEKVGYITRDIAANAEANAYRESLLAKQEAVAAEISRDVLAGHKLDVKWNLTLAANIISANVEYGRIEAIKALASVEDVVVEMRYEPAVVSRDADDPNMSNATEMTMATLAWAQGYTGAGSKVAIVDTGLDLDHQSFDAGAFEYALSTLDKEIAIMTPDDLNDDVVSQLNITKSIKGAYGIELPGAAYYENAKVPFRANYVDLNLDVTHLNDTQEEHGSHVASIAAANRYVPTADGGYTDALTSVLTQGEAPDAQVMVMKVFGAGGGAYDSDYMAAIEDAIVLGADAVNLSLGSSVAGFTTSSNAIYGRLIGELEKSDIVWVNSAGNNSYWAQQSTYTGGYNYLDDANFATGGSPATFPYALSVASVDNNGYTGAYFSVDGSLIFYTENLGYGNTPITGIPGDYDFVYVDGPGVEDNDYSGNAFDALGAEAVSGKIAICNRGSSSFFAKANAAAEMGAAAVIVVNNTEGTINMNLTGYEYTVPAVSVTMADGELFKAGDASTVTVTVPAAVEEGEEPVEPEEIVYNVYTGKITVGSGVSAVNYGNGYYTMSDFSSWGVPGNLTLKPEITAPGGNIYAANGTHVAASTREIEGGTDRYENMSGTSMAAPQVAGLSAVMAQYIRENDLLEKTGLTQRQLIHSLFMSTAMPLIEKDSGSYYSVMNQGAGLVDVDAAINAKSYVLMDESATASAADGKVKVELLDDPEREGKYSATFTITNFSDEDSRYELSADFFTQDIFRNYLLNAQGTPISSYYYRDTWTVPLEPTSLVWYVDGEEFGNEGLNYDFDGNGLVGRSDIQYLAEYIVGNVDSIENAEYADFDQDDDIDTYDAYQILNAIEAESVYLHSGESVEIKVEFDLKAALDDYDFKGTYVEGYIYASEVETEDGAIGVTHSIPVFGYYGSWDESTMFDHGSAIDTIYGLGKELTPYMTAALGPNAGLVKTFLVKYAGEDGDYIFGGNPVAVEKAYHPERDALNSLSTISGVRYTLIRNAVGGIVVLTDESGEPLFSKKIGNSYAAYYYPAGGEWRNTNASQSIGYDLSGLAEGTRVNAYIQFAPEYYKNENGRIDFDSLGDATRYSISFVIDNTAPEIESVAAKYDFESGGFNEIDFTVSDNQFIAGAFLYNENGDLLKEFGSDEENEEAGIAQDFVADLTEVYDDLADVDEHLMIQVYDYAANLSTYKINLNSKELKDDVTLTANVESLSILRNNTAKINLTYAPWGCDETTVWTSSDETVATVTDTGIVKGVAAGNAVITAQSVAYPEASVSVDVEVYTIDVTLMGGLQDAEGNPMMFTWDLENDDNWQNAGDLSKDLTAMAYDWNTDEGAYFYQQDFSGYMHKVNLETLEIEETSAATTGFGAPVEDFDFPFYNNEANETHMAFAVADGYLLFAEDVMDNSFDQGYDLTPYLERYTGASRFTAIAWAGSFSGYDVFYALDDMGFVWTLMYNGDLSFGYAESDLKLTFASTGDTLGNSLVLGQDGNLYLAHFNGSTSELYQLVEYYVEDDPETEDEDEEFDFFFSERLGDIGADAWPCALISVSPNEDEEQNADEPGFRAVDVNVDVIAENLEAVELYASEKSAEEPVEGTLNAVKAERKAVARPQAGEGDVIEDESKLADEGTVEFTESKPVTNGIIEFTFNTDEVVLNRFEGLVGISAYNSVDNGDGTVTYKYAYVSDEDLPAETALAEAEFSKLDAESDASVTLKTTERNDEHPEGENPVNIEVTEPHVHDYEPEWEHNDELTEATITLTCSSESDCGEGRVLTETVGITYYKEDPTCEKDGVEIWTAISLLGGGRYEYEPASNVLPATGHIYDPETQPTWDWSDDHTMAVAHFKCSECDKITNAVATSITEESESADCETEGTTVFTASVVFQGVTYTDSQTVPLEPTGHEWGEPTYVWTEDNGSVTATRICAHDSTHVETETVETTYTETVRATCLTSGTGTYTAEFQNAAFAPQTKNVVIDALNHEWGEPTYEWDGEDSILITATRVCLHDSKHIETENAVAVYSEEESKAPTCEEDGKLVYIATFKNEAFQPQTKEIKLEARGHYWTLNHENEPEWAEDYSKVTLHLVCANDETHTMDLVWEDIESSHDEPECEWGGGTQYTAEFEYEESWFSVNTYVEEPARGHDFTAAWTWSDDGTMAYVTLTCSRSAEHTQKVVVDKSGITTEVTKKADCETPGETTYTATVVYEGATYTDTKVIADVPATGHKYGEPTWTWNDANTEATAKFVCANNEEHVAEVKATLSENVTRPAMPGIAGSKTVTATVEFEGKTYTDAKTVSIEALPVIVFPSDPTPTPQPDPEPWYEDVAEDAYYAEAVKWSDENGIIAPVSESIWNPDGDVTRGQFIINLYKAAGTPAAEGENPFEDVTDAELTKAVVWAVGKGIAKGVSATRFAPDSKLTRAHAVTFLYRAVGSPDVSGVENVFTDITADWYADAVKWAVSTEVTNGTTATTFSPDSQLTRAHTVTFLYRAKDLVK